MYSSKNVAITLELGHKATVKGKKTNDGYTHDWEVFVQGGANSNIELFIEKIVFYLHESFQKPKRVLRAPPYKVSEVGYGCFTLPIEVYFKTNEEPRKAKFEYDLFLQSLDSPPISKIRREKLTFIKPNEEFKKKLLQSGGTEIQTLEESKLNEKSSKPRPSSGAKIKPTAPQSSSQSSTEICKKVKVESRKEVQKPKESDQFTALFGEIIKPQSSQKVRQIPKNSKEIEKGKNESLLKSKEKREKEKVGNSSLLPNSEIISTKKNKDKKENSKDRNNKVEKNREKDRKSIAKDVEKTHGKLKYKELEKEKSDGKHIAKETDSKKKALPSQEHQSVKKQRLKDGKSDDSKIEQEEEKNKHKHPKSKLTDEHKEISKISQKKDKCSEKHLKNAPNPHLPESTLGSKQSPKFTEYVTQRSPHISNPTERTRKEARFPQLQSNHSNAVSQASPHSNVHPSASSNPLNAQVNTSSSITKGNQGHVSKVPIQSHKSPIEERARSNSSSRSRSPILTLSSSSSPQRSLPSSRSSSPLESQKFRSRSVSRSRSRSTSKSNMGSYNSSRSRSRSPSTRFCSRSASRSRSESKSGNSSSSCDSSPSRSREPKRNRVGKGAINPLDILARDISESSSEGEDKLHSPPSKSSQESMMMPPSTASTVKSFQSLHKGKGKNDSRHKLVSSPKHDYATGTENVKCTEKNTLDSQKTVRPNFNANGMSECNNRAKDTKLSPLQEIPNDTESQPMPNPNESSPLYNIDPNYIDQLWELKNKIVTSFSDRAKVQEIVKIVSDATSYRINHSHFTFDLCSLDKQTINKLYQCLS